MYTLLSRAGHVLQRMLGLMTASFGNRLPAIKSLVHQNSTTYILVLQSLELLASSRLFSNSSRVELPRSLDSRREEYDRHNEKRRARYAEDATFRKEEFAREHNRTNNFDYRRSQAFKSWVIRQLKKGQSASSIIWDTHVPLLRQDTPGRLNHVQFTVTSLPISQTPSICHRKMITNSFEINRSRCSFAVKAILSGMLKSLNLVPIILRVRRVLKLHHFTTTW